MRAFISIELNQDIKDQISKIQQRFKFLDSRVSLIPKENLHLTLKFLGDLTVETQLALSDRLKNALHGFSPFEMELAGSGVFPSEKRIRIVWIGIRLGTDSLEKLNKIITPICTDLGFQSEDKPFVPHLTIGRVKWVGDRKALVARVHSVGNDLIGKQSVSQVHLQQSILTSTKPMYHTVNAFVLQ